jgi:hypothetical protein
MNLKVLLVRFAMTQHKSQKGFLTFAQNTDSVDYLRLAYLQAMNIKSTQKSAEYAVIVDKATALLVTEQHRQVFDYVIELTDDYNDPSSQWKLLNEWQVFWLTPFKETIKLESDVLFSRDINHWWNTFRLKDVVLSTGCKNYLGKKSDVRRYRQLFDDNNLPDVYNGLMYFRYSNTAVDFFVLAKQLTLAWLEIKDQILKNCREDTPSTDVLYAIVTQVIGRELCTIPSADFINFVHMKPGINGLDDNRPWRDSIIDEFDGDTVRINNINQYHPVHYFDKDFATDELIKYYEQRIKIH